MKIKADIEEVEHLFVWCTKSQHEALICEIKERMRRVRDGTRECIEGEDGILSMGRVDRVQEKRG